MKKHLQIQTAFESTKMQGRCPYKILHSKRIRIYEDARAKAPIKKTLTITKRIRIYEDYRAKAPIKKTPTNTNRIRIYEDYRANTTN
ncbi:hypothetical protein [Psychroflexus lacisalsi]|nr:hypothetical protein [Psychroflexus lacisalsi]MBZ9618837.1 hypothetical protein [Psychroflexus lacisalsi]